ncbi:MAG: DSD1 family PLP-dependent enzyme [Thermomicrobiales bacterium]
MLTTLVGLPLDQIDTPALLVDLPTLDRNIALMAEATASRGVGWRPHAKAHKSPAIAHRLLNAGALGVTCAKLGEAEVFAASGVRDILIANEVVGPIKARRLAALATYCDIMVAVDSLENARQLDAAAREFDSHPRVVIELDSGMTRAGGAPGEPAVALAKELAAMTGIRFAGLMSWEGHTLGVTPLAARQEAIRAAVSQVTATAEAIRAAGIPVAIVSVGGTGTFLTSRELDGVTEVQAGGGIWGDRFYRDLEVPVQPALSVMVTVTSRPAPNRIVVDAGRKTIDPSNVVPEVVGLDGVTSVALSAEHGTITLDAPNDAIRVGDRLMLHVGYSDQAIHLHENLIMVREGRVIALWPTLTRGKLQ